MMALRWLKRIFPIPRETFTWKSPWPLLLFLVVLGGTLGWFVWNRQLTFARPWMLLVLVFSLWFWWMHFAGYGGLRGTRKHVSLWTRLTLLALFAVALAEPRAVRTSDVVSVVYTLDVSESVGDAIENQLEFVAATVTRKPPTDEAGIVIFGRDAQVDLPPRTVFPYEPEDITSIANSNSFTIDKQSTNIEQALSLAAAMLPEENRGKIVLFSDGIDNEGSVSRIVDELKSREISVEVLPLNYSFQKEVWLERIDLPRFVKIGETYETAIVLSSLTDGTGTLKLYENDQLIYDESVDYRAGKNRIRIPIALREPGYYQYTARIEVPDGQDSIAENNTILNYLYIEGEGKVLIVTDPTGSSDDRDWQYFARALREGKRLVETIDAYSFPRDSLSLMPYDCVVFANVPADAFDTVQLEAMSDSVRELGTGFLMLGGENSYGPGGYHRSPIEEALPVSMDIKQKKVLPKGALAIILHTCEFAQGNTWGKRITKQAINVLSEQDEVGVLIYGELGEEWLFDLTPVSDYDSMVPKINGAFIGDMPSFATTMNMGLTSLAKNDAATKHMIIISDGDATPPPPAVVQGFKDNQISISTIAIFPHGNREVGTLRAIAAATGGNYYFPSDPRLLPSIFIKEAKTLRRTMIQNKTVQPQADFPSTILKGIDALPELHGYVLVSAKNRAETILNVPVEAEGEESMGEVDPILAVWKYGLGTTAAFTSDLSSNWGRDWLGWARYQAFVEQLITRISRTRQQGNLQVWTERDGNRGVIIVEDFDPEQRFLDVEAVVTGPREQSENVVLKQVGPRRYQAEVPLWGEGRYQVVVVGSDGEKQDRAIRGLIVPYSPEFLRFQADPVKLQTIANRTGGTVLNTDSLAPATTEAEALARESAIEEAVERIYGERAPKESTRPVFDWFLIALACLLPLDVAIRRIQFDPSAIWNWMRRKQDREGPTETMQTLLRRKESVAERLEVHRKPKSLQRPATGRPITASAKGTLKDQTKSDAAAETQKSETANDPTTTTGRLLQMKRQRSQEEDDQ